MNGTVTGSGLWNDTKEFFSDVVDAIANSPVGQTIGTAIDNMEEAVGGWVGDILAGAH